MVRSPWEAGRASEQAAGIAVTRPKRRKLILGRAEREKGEVERRGERKSMDERNPLSLLLSSVSSSSMGTKSDPKTTISKIHKKEEREPLPLGSPHCFFFLLLASEINNKQIDKQKQNTNH